MKTLSQLRKMSYCEICELQEDIDSQWSSKISTESKQMIKTMLGKIEKVIKEIRGEK